MNDWRTTLGLWVGLTALTHGAEAQAPDAPHGPAEPTQSPGLDDTPEANTPRSQLAALGCDASGDVLVQGKRMWAACGPAGVWVGTVQEDGSLAIDTRLRTSGVATAVFRQGGQLWVSLQELTARPLAVLRAPGEAAAPPETLVPPRVEEDKTAGRPERDPAPPKPTAEYRVLSVRERSLVIDGGRAQGLALGDHVELFRRTTSHALGEETEEERTALVGEVIALAQDRAQVSLGLTERIPEDVQARVTDRPTTDSRWVPPLVRDTWSLRGGVRPYLPLGQLGFAVLADLATTYYAERAAYVTAAIQPAGGMISEERDAASLGARLAAGYAHDYFAVGLGAGVLRYGRVTSEWDEQLGRRIVHRSSSLSLSIDQEARLGALDGLHLRFHNAFVLFEDEFRFGWVDASLQFPLNRRTWLLASGGGSEGAGAMFFQVSLRRLVRGNGRDGSLFVSPAVGVAGAANHEEEWDEKFLMGPLVAIDLEWRWSSE